MAEKPKLFVSIFAYVLGKVSVDPVAAVTEEIELGEKSAWPAFRTLGRLRKQVWPIQLHVTHSSLIDKARSQALGCFLQGEAPRLVMIDDDVEASDKDLAKMLAADDVDILLAPCALRGMSPAAINVVVHGKPRVRETGGVRVFAVESGGFALSLMTRAAAERLKRDYPDLHFADPKYGSGVGVFLQLVREGAWWGEDAAACARAHWSDLRVEALCDVATTHAGLTVIVDPRFFERDKLGS